MEEQRPPANRIRRKIEIETPVEQQPVAEMRLPARALSVLEYEGIWTVLDLDRVSSDRLVEMLGRDSAILVVTELVRLGKRKAADIAAVRQRAKRTKRK